MVRKKKERTRAKFTGDQMTAAVQEVKTNGTSLRIAADMFDVNFVTLRRYVLKERNDPNTKMEPNYAVRLIFSTEQERSLSEYIKTCSKMAFGLNTQKVRELAYEMAVRNNINMPDTWRRNKCASKDWLRAFIKRTRSLSIRKPEACSLSRLTSFTKPNVERFFLQLQKIYEDNPEVVQEIQIYNLDETATTTVQRPHKVVTQKGVKQLNQCTSAERGLLATTCAIIRANGTFLPPIIIFPRKKFVPHMLNGAPPGTLGLANPSGWMTAELFVEVLDHFIKHTGVTKERPCLLIYDNHESHVSLEIAEKAKNNGIIILTLPSHMSNKLQPLDKAVFYSFKNFYNDAIDSWLLTHPAVPMTLYQIAECVGIAHSKSMTPENILNGFRSTGIYPFNKNIFMDADFLVSSVTDRPEDLQKENLQQGMVVFQEDLNDEQDAGGSGSGNDTAVASCSTTDTQQCTDDKGDSTLEIASTTKDYFISPFEIRGFPKAAPRKNLNRTRKSKKSVILTSTPEMKELSYKTENKKTPKTEAVKKVKRTISADKKNTKKKAKHVKKIQRRTQKV
ncbi:uncharacterized protein LOC111692544 [Anoplophora glabripennis]|uniref:uncharacterized protein LOC111692544 n=1 Tax=Anoplophora glabripennis TaxID=217634 RepID=UPI000C770CBB|nr:uncharacterized protein LOC111692544 [Anoplophora glabripennis]